MDKSKAIDAGVQLASKAGIRFNSPINTMKSLNKNNAKPLKTDMPMVWPALNMRPVGKEKQAATMTIAISKIGRAKSDWKRT